MVFLKKHRKLTYFMIAILIGLFFSYPYLFKNFLPIEHDTFFHLSRIEGYASSLKEGVLYPRIYPYKNNGFGYASPLFYCDIFLFLPACFYLLGMPLALVYKLFILGCTILTCFTMMLLVDAISKRFDIALLLGFAYTFSNYRITDVYVRGALGEVTAMIFLPVLLLGIYYLEQSHPKTRITLIVGLGGLALSHNLTFFLSVIIFVLFILFSYKKWNASFFKDILVSSFIAFLLTAFYTLPMLEQTFSQEFNLHYYGASSHLEEYSMPLWKYFANQMVFGYGNKDYDKSLSMLVNAGYFLSLMPLFYLFIPKKNSFGTKCLILGYIFLLLPMSLIPWQYLFFLRILQFPWRLTLFSTFLLCVPIAYALKYIKKGHLISYGFCLLLAIEGIYHLQPVFTRTFGITNQTNYSELLDGSIVDPYYSASYVRVELAGGDYLPIESPDFRKIPNTVQNENHESLDIKYIKTGISSFFEITEKDLNQTILLPITYYKGYYLENLLTKEKVPFTKSKEALISCIFNEPGDYGLMYVGTSLQTATLSISLCTFITILFYFLYTFYKKYKNSKVPISA